MKKKEISELILRFIGDLPGLGEWEWDDFISIRDKDPEIEAVRRKVLEIEIQYPPEDGRGWCSEEGINKMRKIAMELSRQN